MQPSRTYQRHKLDALVCIGGRETQDSAYLLSQKGLNVLTLPKGIDNDLAMTDVTIGFDTAMSIATEAVDRLHSTAHSHHRIIIVEIMGRNTGWLTLGSGLAGGADVIIIPEIPYDVRKIATPSLNAVVLAGVSVLWLYRRGEFLKIPLSFLNAQKKVNQMIYQGDEGSNTEKLVKR